MNQTFTSQEVGQMLGIVPKDIQNWATRRLIIGESEGGKGKHRRYSLHGIMEIAVARALMQLGLGPDRAFAAAQSFAHMGDGPTGYVGETYDLRRLRAPGMPYHHSLGSTFLVIGADGARVELEADGQMIPQVYGDQSPDAVILVNVSAVFHKTCIALMQATGNEGYHPLRVLDAAYPEGTGVI